jgi:multidrug efflux pump subunit AcrA (membrane-fusion protein)
MAFHRKYLLIALGVVAIAGTFALMPKVRANGSNDERSTAAVKVTRGSFVRTLRLTGIIESVRYHNVTAPRLVGVSGPGANTLIITKLARGGAQVNAGDLLVEFDRQNQLKAAFDKRSEYLDFEEQIRKKRAEHEQTKAKDEAELAVASNNVDTARLEMKKNEFLAKILAEKNALRMEEAQARLKQLQETFELKRRAEQAEVKILEIQRDRARTAMNNAEQNATRMVVKSPLPGLVVLRMNWRGSQMVEIQEGEEARPGMPIMLVVDPSAMLVRVKVNQADLHLLRAGQSARISLDAYPGLEFQGKVEQVAPVGTTSRLTDRVRNFVAIVSIQGNHPKLMPDLSAAVDVELERKENAIIVPRDAVFSEEKTFSVRVVDGGDVRERPITLGSMSDHEAVVTSGLEPGMTVQRHVAR